jgi:hypothetical protein
VNVMRTPRISRAVALALIAAIASGCVKPTAKHAEVMICEIHEVKAEVCGSGGCLRNPGFRMTITFIDENRTRIALGNVFGSQTVLQRAEDTLYSGDNQDKNVVQFERKGSISEDTLMLNTISGQMYFFSKTRDAVTEEFYAHCEASLANAQ